MGTCERCGASAFDSRGVCRNCGWQAPMDLYDDAPSLGETRAADPALSPPVTGRYTTSGSGIDRASTVAAQTARTARASSTSGPGSGANGATSRFCGSCGARVTGTETFCGQCGKPLGNPSGPGMGAGGSQPHYQGGVAGWDDDDPNAYTEALPEALTIAASHNPYAADPYARSYAPQYGARTEMNAGGMSRSTRMTLGVVFLAISILLALGAIAVLAF